VEKNKSKKIMARRVSPSRIHSPSALRRQREISRVKRNGVWSREIKKAAKKMARAVAKHVDADRGMTNKMLNVLADSATDLLARCRLAKHRVLGHEPRPSRSGKVTWIPVAAHDPDRIHSPRYIAPKPLTNRLKKYFRGVYCADELPFPLLRSRRPFSIIVNLATRYKKKAANSDLLPPSLASLASNNGHFVLITTNKTDIFYCDPFGGKCPEPRVRAFLKAFRPPGIAYHKEAKYLKKRIQSPTSVHCGLYALLFAMAREANLEVSDFPFATRFHEQNDKKCVEYINLMMKSIC
jgi:hypothetical protein